MYKYLYVPMNVTEGNEFRPLVEQVEKHMDDGWQLVHSDGSWLTACIFTQRWRVCLYKDSPIVSKWPRVIWQRVYDNYWSRHPEQIPDFQYP